MATNEAPNLFEQCRIFIVCSQDVSRETAEQVRLLSIRMRARQVPELTNQFSTACSTD